MSVQQTFAEKQLRYTFSLNTNARFQNGTNTLRITGLRSTATITYPGPPTFPSATLRIWGMAESDMQALTALTQGVLTYTNNSVLVEANSGNGWSAAFAGQLVTSVIDFSDTPRVALNIFSQTLGYELLMPETPTSYPVAASIATVIQTIAAKMGKTLVNSGVTGSFNGSVYFPGTPAYQLRAACKKAGIAFYLDIAGVVEIAPKGKPRNSPVWVLSPQTGLVLYPTLDSVNLIGAQAVYNPGLRYGGPIKIQGSQQKSANGDWMIYDVAHYLSSLMPKGPWFTRLTAQPYKGIVGGTP